MKRIVVNPPQSDARRERVERKLFQQLAAVRVVERAESVIPPGPPRHMRWLLGGGALAAAAALAVLVASGGDPAIVIPAPSRVVTPVGGTSQVTLPGALIEARSDTSVEVKHGPGGAITLVIERGTVECDVEHRVNRPPFRVVSGDVTVEVVGTRFTVARSPNPRVDVARGTVRVTAPGGQWLVEAGETWPKGTRTAVAPQVPEPERTPLPEPPEPPGPSAKRAVHTVPSTTESTTESAIDKPAVDVARGQTRERARESYKIANRLATTEPRKAAQLYRAIATDGKGMEAVALVSLAEVELKLGEPHAALSALDELARRFPASANAEDAAWLRYEALRAMGKRDEARGAAADYLRQFPNGAYAGRLLQTR